MVLQWGHALSGMDIGEDGRQRCHRCHASMGPCPFRHGYKAIYETIGGQHIMLQWGHALSGMDIASTQFLIGSSIMLQWGHALSGMDI